MLAIYLVIGYWRALTLPFLGDDYFFLEKVRDSSFLDLWKPERLFFLWYRPWSREFHYWVLSRLFGQREVFYHAASFALWLAVAVLYFKLAEKLARDRAVAMIALAGVASLALWASPLFWVAGAQDLWMLVFGLLFLHALIAGRDLLACLPLALALLSKETAAILPALGVAYVRLVERESWRSTLRRSAGPLAILLAWGVLHPTLITRFLMSHDTTAETASRLPWAAAVTRAALSQVNLDQWPAPESGWLRAFVTGVLGAALLVALVVFAGRPAPPTATRDRVAAFRFGIVWAVLGWAVLLLPSIGWHAYYGVLGTLGCWLVIALALAQHRRVALVIIAAVSILRGARADTPSWDWGTDWYQFRAGAILGSIRERLFVFHPTLPHGSRLFFAHLPNNIGLLAGDGPAIRIWYDDPTLRGLYYSAYAPRATRDTAGADYFFRFDSLRVLVEVRTGADTLPAAMIENPRWQEDHEVLAALFIRTGDVGNAAGEYGKLARAFPGRPDYALYAGAAHEAIGAPVEARFFYREAARTWGEAAVRKEAAELLRALPSGRTP